LTKAFEPSHVEDKPLKMRPGRICKKCSRGLSAYNPYPICLSHRNEEASADGKPGFLRRPRLTSRFRYQPMMPKVKLPLHAMILRAVCVHFGVRKSILISSTRRSRIVRMRHIACYLLKTEADFGWERIGELIGKKDHTSALQGFKKVRDNPQDFQEDLVAIQKLYKTA
jgi:hypothetical protein